MGEEKRDLGVRLCGFGERDRRALWFGKKLALRVQGRDILGPSTLLCSFGLGGFCGGGR